MPSLPTLHTSLTDDPYSQVLGQIKRDCWDIPYHEQNPVYRDRQQCSIGACPRSNINKVNTHPESLFVTGGCCCCGRAINTRRSVHSARVPVSSVLHRWPFRSGRWRWEMRKLKRWMRGHGTWTHGTTAKRQGHSVGNQVTWTYLNKTIIPIYIC